MPLARQVFSTLPTFRLRSFLRRLGELALALLVLGEVYLLAEGLVRLIF